MKNILKKSIWTLALCILATSVYAQISPKKFKKAKGIEVTYQSSYKGKISPGGMLMRVCGDQVALENVFPKPKGMPKGMPKVTPENKPAGKRLVTKNYVDYAAQEFYRWSELPNGDIISAATPFEFGKNLTEIGTNKYLGLNCKILRTSINSNTIEIWYTNDLAFRGTPQANVGVPDGLVLRVIRNGETIQEATDITPMKEEMSLLLGREPTVSELAEKLDVDISQAAELITVSMPVISLTATDEKGTVQLDIPTPAPEEEISEKLALKTVVNSLDERDRRLIELRYFKGLTQVKTAKELGMSQVQVSRREKAILMYMRKAMS